MSDTKQSIVLEIDPAWSEQKAELFRWWIQTAASDFAQTTPKMDEYSGTAGGSADLRLMGDNLAELLGWSGVSDAVKQELGCWFYLQGKIARMVSNYQQRQPAKPDTLLDSTVYSLMMRRLQETGNWP